MPTTIVAPKCELAIIATAPEALVELCGLSLLERLLRNLRRIGFEHATIFSATAEPIAQHLAHPSWARTGLVLQVSPQKGTALAIAELRSVSEKVLLVDAGFYVERRLLAALIRLERTSVLIDSAPPRKVDGKWFTGAALLESSWLSEQPRDEFITAHLLRSAQAGAIALLDVDAQLGYLADMRRTIRPLWFPAPSNPEEWRWAERQLLDAAQNGTLDLPAKVHAPIETWIIARLCKTRITPNQITLFTAGVSALATALFALGRLVPGVALALLVMLDGLDGKQARVEVETTELGKREHALDCVLELSWWTALAYHFATTRQIPNAYSLLALLITSDLFDRLAKSLAKRHTGRNLDDLSPIDRFVRLIGGRRNVYVWMLAGGLAAGIADKAFVGLCWWGALTAAVHVLRAIFISRGQRVAE